MAHAFPITIFHNPACGTSRNTLAMIEAAGYAPTVVEYLKAGWTPGQLAELLAAMDATPRDILTEKGTPAAELGLLEPGATDDQILDAMVAHPILVNRPIVETPKGVKLCRPSEMVFTLLERRPDTFTKEDGEVVRRGKMLKDLRARPAERSDAAAIADIYNQGIEDRVGTFETKPRSIAQIESWFDEALAIVPWTIAAARS